MNYTLTQAIDRTRDLSGAIKAADELERLTADTLGAKEHEVTLARQAHDKAVANQQMLRAERDEIADHIAALVRKVGDPLEMEAPGGGGGGIHAEGWGGTVPLKVDPAFHPETPAFNSIFTEGADFQAQAMQNGLDRIGEALDAARS